MRVIGDVHCKMDDYIRITDGCKESIQVGDFGAGFVALPELSIAHRWLRGNHDDPAVCLQHSNWIPDGWTENGMMFVGGARSIDQHVRKIGVDWWDDEECSWSKLDEMISDYASYKPSIMISHDCPRSIALEAWPHVVHTGGSRTSSALQAMFEIHQPKLWLFGHYHQPLNIVVDGTRFICLAELQYIDL